jgi:hypothetical protein
MLASIVIVAVRRKRDKKKRFEPTGSKTQNPPRD